jgi:hypothetical protein
VRAVVLQTAVGTGLRNRSRNCSQQPLSTTVVHNR